MPNELQINTGVKVSIDDHSIYMLFGVGVGLILVSLIARKIFG